MIFPFTFNINVTGLSNPFLNIADSDDEEDDRMESPRVVQSASLNSDFGSYLDRKPSFINSVSADPITPSRSSRKRSRGWEPAISEPSWSAPTPEYTTGYLDNPSKYRPIANGKGMAFDENEALESTAELPPSKRRRTLADSIISTAISAALIGSAVGLTFYRLWRGRQPPQHLIEAPPPPYQEGTWVEAPQPEHPVRGPITPRSRSLRPSATPKSATRRRRLQHKTPVQRRSPSPPPPSFLPAATSPVSPPPQFDFSDTHTQGEEEENEMDWLGSKLSALIEEGKKALNREVVIGASHKDDEVDDGSGGWVDETTTSPSYRPSHTRSHSSSSTSRRHRPSSFRRQARRPLSLASSPAPPLYSPNLDHSFGYAGGYRESMSPHLPSQYGSEPPNSPRLEETWESPELREQMEIARARVLARCRRS